jgi:hypothetical protein
MNLRITAAKMEVSPDTLKTNIQDTLASGKLTKGVEQMLQRMLRMHEEEERIDNQFLKTQLPSELINNNSL